MDQETNKKLEELTGKLLKDFSTETPSFDFTTKVMSKVEGLSTSNNLVYKPLISNKSWIVLIMLFAAVLLYAIFGNIEFENSWTTFLTPESLPNLGALTLPEFKISNVFIYGIVGFAFFTGVQIFMLKHHFNKRLAAF